jgi:hypothetical protein
MSRTYKTQPNRLKYKKYFDDDGYYWVNYTRVYVSYYTKEEREGPAQFRLKKAGHFPKLKRFEPEWKWWQTTPSWWIRTYMQKPQRRAGSMWEREVVKTFNQSVHEYDKYDNVEQLDTPSVSRKPHIYYW